MRPGPSAAKAAFLKHISVESPPKSVDDWLVEIGFSEGWFSNEADAREAAEKWSNRFLTLLRRELGEYNAIGRFVPFVFNSSSEYVVQGCAFIERHDSDEVREAKSRRSLYASYVSALADLTPREFEALCVGLLQVMGMDEPTITSYSADEGIDFYGRLNLRRVMFADAIYPGIQHQLSVWTIGQAKHYKAGDVSTFEIRDLVGAVGLARGRAFGAVGEKYADLSLRVCDPIFYLFFTTGRITANTWRLLDKSGVAGMDGDMVASFLADNSIGTQKGTFCLASLREWIKGYELAR